LVTGDWNNREETLMLKERVLARSVFVSKYSDLHRSGLYTKHMHYKEKQVPR